MEPSVNLALLLKQPLLKKHLIKQVSYYADGCYVFKKNHALDTSAEKVIAEQYQFQAVDSCRAKVVIVAKAHYQQLWQSYSAVSKKELQQILALQKSTENLAFTTFQIIENVSIDGFEVKKTIFDTEVVRVLGEQKLLIPETELFTFKAQVKNNGSNKQAWLASFITPTGTLFASFFSGKKLSAYAKGLINNIETFKLSTGLPKDVVSHQISKEHYPTFLFNSFTTKKIEFLYRNCAFNKKAWFNSKELHLLYWAPLLTALMFYILANSYLWLQTYNIKTQLAEQGNEISQLLSTKQQQDKQSKLLASLNNEFSKTATVHWHWSLIYQLVESGMLIERFSFRENTLSIRGQAQNASKVLADISNIPHVISASLRGLCVNHADKKILP
jgi:hypothetical protein